MGTGLLLIVLVARCRGFLGQDPIGMKPERLLVGGLFTVRLSGRLGRSTPQTMVRLFEDVNRDFTARSGIAGIDQGARCEHERHGKYHGRNQVAQTCVVKVAHYHRAQSKVIPGAESGKCYHNGSEIQLRIERIWWIGA